MKRLPAGALKALKIAHVVCAQVWLGSVVAVFFYGLHCFNSGLGGPAAAEMVGLIPTLYQRVVLPFGVAMIVQGLVYGLFSQYGFVRLRWIRIKWILMFFVMILTGAGSIHSVLETISKLNAGEITSLAPSDGLQFLAFVAGQIALLCTITAISVLKPKDGKAGNGKTAAAN
jgi:hypothetical protein